MYKKENWQAATGHLSMVFLSSDWLILIIVSFILLFVWIF